MSGILFIVSAASGTGKTSLVNKVISKDKSNLCLSISHTTREIRDKEIDDVNYHFISESEFNTMIQLNLFLEYAKVFGNYYGTSKDWVYETLESGKDVILELDWQGALQVKKIIPSAVTIFILPPSKKALEERLIARKRDSKKIISERLEKSCEEISYYKDYEYLIINNDFDVAVQEIEAVIQSSRLKTKVRQEKEQKLLDSLLG